MIKRRNYFIDKKFQTSFAVKFIVLLVLEIALIAGLFAYISVNTLTTGYTNSVLTIERTSNFFLLPMALVIVITAVGTGLAGMAVFILLSHRIAGPLYRFEKDLIDMARGDLTKRINLRKTDQLTGLKEALNSLIVGFDGRVARIKLAIDRLKAVVESEPGNQDKVREAISDLSKEVEHFKVSSGKSG